MKKTKVRRKKSTPNKSALRELYKRFKEDHKILGRMVLSSVENELDSHELQQALDVTEKLRAVSTSFFDKTATVLQKKILKVKAENSLERALQKEEKEKKREQKVKQTKQYIEPLTGTVLPRT